MEDKTQKEFNFDIDITTDETTESSVPVVLDQKAELAKQSEEILNEVVIAQDPEKVKDLTYLFNLNQNKKTMARVDKCNEVLDKMLGNWEKRVTERPDEMDHETLLRGINTIQGLMEKGQRQVAELSEQTTPMIQINQQTNEIHVGDTKTSLSKDSRDRVRQAIMGILTATAESSPVDVVTETNIINVDAEPIQEAEIVVIKDNEEDD